MKAAHKSLRSSTNRLSSSPARSSRKGFNLIEVMIGLGILSVLGLALVGNTILNMKMAHAAVLRNTAYSTAQSFLEQIRSLEIEDIEASVAAPATVPLETVSVSALEALDGDYFEKDYIYLNDPAPDSQGRQNHKKILIDLQETASGDLKRIVMDMWLDVNIEKLQRGSGYIIEIDFIYSTDGLTAAFLPKKSIRLATIKSNNQPLSGS